MTTTEQQQIDTLLAGLTHEELLTLIERIARQFGQIDERKPLPLYGIWKEAFPEGADIDKDLREMRTHTYSEPQ